MAFRRAKNFTCTENTAFSHYVLSTKELISTEGSLCAKFESEGSPTLVTRPTLVGHRQRSGVEAVCGSELRRVAFL